MNTPLQRLFPTVAFILSISALSAQIPNGGFESWVDQDGYMEPVGWLTYNEIATVGGPTVQQGTPGTSGNYHVVISTRLAQGAPVPVQGWISAGGSSSDVGFPCTTRPTTLTGQWQYGVQPNDTAQIQVALSKWNSGTQSSDGIAWGTMEVTGDLSTWQMFSVPLTYYSNDIPDTAYIQIVSSINFLDPVVGSFLKVDDLAFVGTVGMDEQADRASILVFPSPAKDVLNISTSEPGEIRLFDVTGRMVLRSRIIGTTTIDVSSFATGLYSYQLHNKDGGPTTTGRWVKE